MGRFRVLRFKDGRHYKLVFQDAEPPDLQPGNTIGELRVVNGQYEELAERLTQAGFEIVNKLGVPLKEDF